MTKTTERSEVTKKRLIDAAASLFSRYGIHRVTIEEICKEAGLSKMTFYRYFDNKIAMARTILEDIYGKIWNDHVAIEQLSIPFEEKIQKILLMKMAYAEQHSKEFLQDLLNGAHPELAEYIDLENQRHLTAIRRLLTEAQKNGEVRSDIKIDFLMYMMNLLRDTFKDEALHSLYPDTRGFIKELFTFFYYGALKR